MHSSSMQNMQIFRDQYAPVPIGRLIDVGSLDVNGSYRPLFPRWEYIGCDVVPGNGVDVVLKDPYHWPIPDNYCDLAICGQALEHIEHDDQAMAEMVRVLKHGAYCCVIAPSAGPPHHEPDYRRYTPDSMRGLAKKVGLTVIRITITPSSIWKDCTMIAQKLGGRPQTAQEMEIEAKHIKAMAARLAAKKGL